MVSASLLELKELVKNGIVNGTTLEDLNQIKSLEGPFESEKEKSLHQKQISVYGTSLTNKNTLLAMLNESQTLAGVEGVEQRFADLTSARKVVNLYLKDKDVVRSAIQEAKWPHLVNEINDYLKEIAALPVLQEHVDTLEGMLSKYREVLPQNHIDRVQKVIEIKKSKLEP